MKCLTLIGICAAGLLQGAHAAPSSAVADAHAQAPVTLMGATQFDLASKISGRTYRIFVYKPALPAPPTGYPVIYVTDGNGMFPLAAAQMALMALAGKAAVVVGIGYPTDDFMRPMMLRYRDLTPVTEDKSLFPTDPPLADADQIGGAELFYRFIAEELRPAVSASYSLDAKDQTLFGHSLGGLFVLGVMFKHPESFNRYVASSPSIWWDNKSVLKDEAAFLAQAKSGTHPLRVLICVGAKEQDPMTHYPGKEPLAEINKKVAQARMVDNARDLAHRLEQSGAKSLVVHFQDFSAEDHLSVVPGAISRALQLAVEPTAQ